MKPSETYNPSFLIKIKGTELRHAATVDVLSVSVTDVADGPDSFSFTVRDRNPTPGAFAGGQFRWLDDGLFDEGNEVEISIGYVDNLQFMLRGDITACTPSFPESGVPTLAVRGFCIYQRLQYLRRDKPFKSSTDAGIVDEIVKDAKKAGIGIKDYRVDNPGIEHKWVAPREGASSANILRQRAERIGYEFVVKDQTLYFQRPRYREASASKLTLEWGRTLRSFSPSLTLYGLVTAVRVRASQTSRGGGKEPLVSEANAGDERVIMGRETGSQIVKRMFPSADQVVVRLDDQDVSTSSEARELALAHLETKSMEFIKGRGACIGMPDLRARMVVELKGLGKRFSGPYYVTSAIHVVDASGYRTEFEVKRNAR